MGAHFRPKYKIKEFYFFHWLNIVELSQKKIVCFQVANLGKVAKSWSREVFFFLNK